MENQIKKCSSKAHQNIDSTSYCPECKVYMCNKCENFHSQLLQFHHPYNLNNNIYEEMFTGLCKEEKHNEQLEFFCKDHNILCCGLCLCKLKKKGKGQHSECNVCAIEDIKEDKKNNLEKNIKILEEASISLEKLISDLKTIIEQVNENKEKLKLNIQKIFTKFRNALNQREDEVLLEVDKKFADFYFDDDILKKVEKLPKRIKLSLENGKKINKEWNNEDKLNLLINDCINIEDCIKELNLINEAKNKYKKFKDIKFNFDLLEENEINKFLENIKILGKLEDEYFSNSLVLENNYKYINNLLTWINPNKNITTKLLYRKSIDGDSYDIFHKLCDNQGATLVLIKSNEGFIIGGYTSLDWDNHSNWKKDNDTFLFSLTNNKKYKKIKSNIDSIYCGKEQGPWFPYIGFRGQGKKNMSQGEFLFRDLKGSYFEDYNKIIPNNGDKYFDVEEVEIYKISY